MANKCTNCGKEDYAINYTNCPEKRAMDEQGMCFGCAYWVALVKRLEKNLRWCRINGKSLTASSALKPGQPAVSQSRRGKLKGHGGREFCIKFHDGRLIRTDDLWLQGTIPDWLRETHPDNAVYIRREEFDALEARIE